MEKEFDLLVFILRAQPFHNEHKRIIDIALEKSKNVLVLVGSAGKARTIRNPFTFQERANMIFGSFEPNNQLIVSPLYDKTYNEAAWIKQVQDIVKDTALELDNPLALRPKIGLIGASKDDATAEYLDSFPQFESVNVDILADVHATEIREAYLSDGIVAQGNVPNNVVDFLLDFRYTEPFLQLHDELEFVRNYKKQWEAAPYPPIFVTTDAIVACSGHVLLVTRRAEPGKGLLALPGGFLNQTEKLVDGMIRELKEETKIKVPDAVLRGSITKQKTFDDPHRSSRGRTITHASLIDLGHGKLPKVKGSDDAIHAGWYNIAELTEDRLFEDHYAIIQTMLELG